MRKERCPACRAGIYVQAEEYEEKGATKPRKRLRASASLVEGLPAVMTACCCAWLLRALAVERVSA